MLKSYYFILPIFFILFLFSCSSSNKIATKGSIYTPNSIKGTWEMKEIHWKTKDTTYSIFNAQPGLFIFSEHNYSIMWVPEENPRIPFKVLANPTEKEIIQGFRSVVFNGGDYIFTDTTVTTTSMIAKVPGFEGGIQYYRYHINGDTLNLTMYDETYPNGNKPGWSGRYVTEFIMKKTTKK